MADGLSTFVKSLFVRFLVGFLVGFKCHPINSYGMLKWN
jgi:hypothetical protein